MITDPPQSLEVLIIQLLPFHTSGQSLSDFSTSVILSLGHRAQKQHFWGKHLCSVFLTWLPKGKNRAIWLSC